MKLNNLIMSCNEYVNIQIEDANSMDILATYNYNDKDISDEFDKTIEKYGDCEWGTGFTFEIQSNWLYVYVEVK